MSVPPPVFHTNFTHHRHHQYYSPGLFPSIEQLQLLSVLVNHDVTVDIARGFWAKYIADEFGDDVEIGDNDRYDKLSNLTVVLKA